MALEREAFEAFKAGEAARSRSLNVESLELARRAGDPTAEVRALTGLMRLSLRASDWETLERLAAECSAVADRAGDQLLRRMPTHKRAEAARMRGELDVAAALYDVSIALNREIGDERMVGVEMGNKAWVAIGAGDLKEAEELLAGARARTDGGDVYGEAFCLLGLARIALERGDRAGAKTLADAERLLAEHELVWDPAEQQEYERTRALARQA